MFNPLIITIMNNDEKRAKVIDLIDGLYGDGGNAVIIMVTDYLTDDDWGNLYDRLEHDGAFSEPEYEELSFDELISKLEYWQPDGMIINMEIGDIQEKFREFIRGSGFECLDETSLDADSEMADYIEENHPNWDTSGFEWSSVCCERDFLCTHPCYPDPIYREMHISFYGDWNKQIGVFNVTD